MFTYPITHMGHNAGGGGGAGFGPRDNYGLFAGDNDYVDISGLLSVFTGANDFTVHIDFAQTNAAASSEHLCSWSDGTNHFSIGFDGSNIGCRLRHSGTNYDLNSSWTYDGSDHVIQITWDVSASTLAGFVDGTAMTVTSTTAVSPTVTTNFILGARQNGAIRFFDGKMYYASVYNDVLTTDELIYERTGGTSGTDPTLANCLGRYLYDDGSGTTVTDSSGNSRDGTATNIDTGTFWN